MMKMIGWLTVTALVLSSCSSSSEEAGLVTSMLDQIPLSALSVQPDSAALTFTARDQEAITEATGVPLNDPNNPEALWDRRLALRGTPKDDVSDGLGFIDRPLSIVHLGEPLEGLKPWNNQASIGFDPDTPRSEAGLRVGNSNFIVQRTGAPFVVDTLTEVDDDVFNGAVANSIDLQTGETQQSQIVVSARDDWRIMTDSAEVASAWQSDTSTLLQDSDLATAAEALDSVEVIDAQLIRTDFAVASDEPHPVTEPFSVFGWGVAVAGGGPLTAATYVFATEEAGEVALSQLESLWRDPPEQARNGATGILWEVVNVQLQDRTVLVTTRPTNGSTTGYFNNFLANGPGVMFQHAA